jgi:hypothetical protein
MGRDLRRYLADRLPAEVPPAQRSVALEIADLAHDATGIAYGADLLSVVARRAGLADEKSVRNALTGLAKRGLEMRVAQGLSNTGQPVYAYKGRQTTYRVPDPSCDALAAPDDGAPGLQAWPLKGPRDDGPLALKGPSGDAKGPRGDSQRAITPFPKGHGVMAPTQEPQNQDHQRARFASLIELGATPDEERRVIDEIKRLARQPIQSMGPYLAAMHRDGKVAPVLAALRAPERDRAAEERRRSDRSAPLCSHDGPPGVLDNGAPRCPMCRREQESAGPGAAVVDLRDRRTAKAR